MAARLLRQERSRRRRRELARVGDVYASFTLLADAIDAVQNFVTVFLSVYLLLIFAYILMSWIRVPYSLEPIHRFLRDVCDPYLRIFRRFIPSIGPLDLSPIVAVIVLIVLMQLVNGVLLESLK
jgi:YggT family protein